jgi:hypothetical protein
MRMLLNISKDRTIKTVPALLDALRETGRYQRVLRLRDLYLTSFTAQKVTANVVRIAEAAGVIVKAASPGSLDSWMLKPRGRPRKL